MSTARPVRASVLARGATFLASFLLFVVAASAGSVTYDVDPASGRVNRATYPDGSFITYTYDGNGNRTGANVTLAADTVPPTAPSGLSATAASGTQINLAWTASTDDRGVANYRVERCQGVSCASFAQIATPTATSYSSTGLTSGVSYSFRVRAADAAGNLSGYSNIATRVTLDTVVPTTPGAPTFSAITATSATATWAPSTDNVGVTGYQYRLNGGTWISTGSTTPSFNITGLTGSTTYTVNIRARDAAVNFSAQGPGSTLRTTDITAPTAPGTPTFSAITANSVTATWTASTDNVAVTNYQYRLNGGTWISTGSTAPSFNITGLTGSTTYTVNIRARDAAGNFSASSGAGTVTTLAATDMQAPGVPGTPTFSSITGTSANATWTAATDNVGVTAYQYSLNGGTWTNTGSATPGVSLTGLSGQTTYTLSVRARDAANNTGAASPNGSFTTLTIPDGVPPTAPGTPTFSSITGTSAVASWTAATDNIGVTGYQYSLNGGAWTTASSGVTLSGLTNGTTYSLQVRARDAAANFGPPSSASFTTTDTAAPSAPGTPSFSSITGSSAVASWSAATDNIGVSGYEYSLNGGAWTAASSGVTLSGLTNGTTYSLQVRARDAAGNVGSASSASFTTLDTAAPSAPGTPSFSSITGSSAVVSFAAASDNVGVAGYEYILNGGGWNAASSGMTVSGLANGTTYSFQVRAYDAAGNRGALSIGSFTTLDTAAPSAPGTPSFSSVGATSAVVSFSAASDNVGVAGYEYLLNGAGWSVASSGMTLSGLATGVAYTVHVRAYDGAGNRGEPSVNSFSTVDNVAPSAPGTPSFSSIGSTSAVASWGAASDNIGVARYEYSVNGGGWVNVGNTTSASVSGLAAGTSNTVAVRAVDAAGNAGGSSSGSVTTIAQVTIANRSVSTTIPGFNGGAALYQLNPSGDILTTSANSGTLGDVGDWLAPKSGMGDFQAFVTLFSGPTSNCGGTLNAWVSLGSGTPTWAAGRGGPSGSTTCTFDLQIRHTGNPSVILGTARIFLTINN